MELAGTTLETIVVFWLFASLWDQWTLPFRIVTPILHLLFSCAQLWGAWVFWNLSKKEARKARGLIKSGPIVVSEEALVDDDGPPHADSREKKNVETRVTEKHE